MWLSVLFLLVNIQNYIIYPGVWLDLSVSFTLI